MLGGGTTSETQPLQLAAAIGGATFGAAAASSMTAASVAATDGLEVIVADASGWRPRDHPTERTSRPGGQRQRKMRSRTVVNPS